MDTLAQAGPGRRRARAGAHDRPRRRVEAVVEGIRQRGRRRRPEARPVTRSVAATPGSRRRPGCSCSRPGCRHRVGRGGVLHLPCPAGSRDLADPPWPAAAGTPEGLAAAARWRAVQAKLAENPVFAEQPPHAVELWERLLAYGAALGVAPAAIRPIPMGAEPENRAGRTYGGRWHQVDIRFRHGPQWGQHPGWALLARLAIAAVGWIVLSSAGPVLWDALDDADGPRAPDPPRRARSAGGDRARRHVSRAARRRRSLQEQGSDRRDRFRLRHHPGRRRPGGRPLGRRSTSRTSNEVLEHGRCGQQIYAGLRKRTGRDPRQVTPRRAMLTALDRNAAVTFRATRLRHAARAGPSAGGARAVVRARRPRRGAAAAP